MGGFARIRNNKITILVNDAEKGSDIDPQETQQCLFPLFIIIIIIYHEVQYRLILHHHSKQKQIKIREEVKSVEGGRKCWYFS